MGSYKEAEEAATEKIMKRQQRLKAARARREAGKKPSYTRLKPRTEKPEIDEEAALKHVLPDLERVRKDKRLKVSEKTLLYLKAKKIIVPSDVNVYRAAPEDPDKETPVTFRGVIEKVNNKFFYAFSH